MAGTFGKRTTGFGAPHPGARSPAPASRVQPPTDTTPTLRFDYRPEPLKSLLATVAMGALAVFATWTARDNDRGLIIDHLIRLDPAQATMFWWGMAVLLGGAFLMALFMLVLAVSPPRAVTLDASGISAPRNAFTTDNVTIDYRSITGMQIVTVKRHRTLHIRHSSGKLAIGESVMVGAFDTLLDALAERCTARR